MSTIDHNQNQEPWDLAEARKPLTLTIELEGRSATAIQAMARLTGLTVSEIARREVEIGTDCSRNLNDFFHHVIEEILQTESQSRINNFTEELRKWLKAGHLHGVDEIDINQMAEDINDAPDEWTRALLDEASKIIKGAA